MIEHRQSMAVLALMAVAAFIATVWASSAVAEGDIYNVFRNQANRSEHQDALIAVVKTRKRPSVVHGLIFVQTTGDTRGEGFICDSAHPRPNDASNECFQEVAQIKETLTVGAINSLFCKNLREAIENCPTREKYLYTSDKKNPVVNQKECENQYPNSQAPKCVCFEIKHDNIPLCPPESGPLGPPSSGTGSGGHG